MLGLVFAPSAFKHIFFSLFHTSLQIWVAFSFLELKQPHLPSLLSTNLPYSVKNIQNSVLLRVFDFLGIHIIGGHRVRKMCF